jgi:hypothetical protein
LSYALRVQDGRLPPRDPLDDNSTPAGPKRNPGRWIVVVVSQTRKAKRQKEEGDMKRKIASIGRRPESACSRTGHSGAGENFGASPSEHPGTWGHMPVRMIEFASA